MTVEDAGGAPLTGAEVLVIDDAGDRYPALSGADGKAAIEGLADDEYTVYAFADGYLPEAVQATQTNGSGAVTVTLDSGELATSNVESRRLTREEIIAAGIDPNDPDNQNMFEFSIHLCFSDTG